MKYGKTRFVFVPKLAAYSCSSTLQSTSVNSISVTPNGVVVTRVKFEKASHDSADVFICLCYTCITFKKKTKKTFVLVLKMCFFLPELLGLQEKVYDGTKTS